MALTEGPGDWTPRFSPDGSSVLFVRWTNEGAAIYRVAAVGGEARRVLADAYAAIWSPDGSQIGFLREVPRRAPGSGLRARTAAVPGSSRNSRAASSSRTRAGRRTARRSSSSRTPAPRRPPESSGASRWTAGRAASVGPAQRSGSLSSVAWSGDRMVYMQDRGRDRQRRARRRAASSFRNRAQRTPGRCCTWPTGRRPSTSWGRAVSSSTRDRAESDAARSAARRRRAPAFRSAGSAAERRRIGSPSTHRTAKRIVFASDRYGNFDIWDVEPQDGNRATS